MNKENVMGSMLVPVIPPAFLFSRMPNAGFMIWSAIPVAEGISVLVAVLFANRIVRKKQMKG